jgi:putative membrane protein
MRISVAGIPGMQKKIIMKSKLTITLVLLGALVFAGGVIAKEAANKSASPAPAQAGALSAQDKSFMAKAAKGGMMEVEWGKWAAQKGQSPDVKKFGNRMVTDHSKANNELMALAAKKGVKLKNEKVAGKWTSDKDYVEMMVKDHEQDLAEFQNEAKNGTDADVKKWAGDTAKVIQKHLTMIKDIHSKMK